MDNHVNSILICLAIHIEHVNHSISVDIGKVEQVVDLFRHFFARNQTERAKAIQSTTALNELLSRFRLSLCSASTSSRLFDDVSCLVTEFDAFRFLAAQVNLIELLPCSQILYRHEKISHAITIKIYQSRRVWHSQSLVLNWFLDAPRVRRVLSRFGVSDDQGMLKASREKDWGIGYRA